MNFTSQPLPKAQAFTLVEVLTVIAIIAVLMGLLLPAIRVAKNSRRIAQAKAAVMNIVAAVQTYHVDHGKYPPADPAVKDTADRIVGDADAGAKLDNSALFNILRSIDATPNTSYAMNPRKIIYFEDKIVSDLANPRAGFADGAKSTKPGCLFDPWGKQYTIVLDSNYDKVISLDSQYTDFSTTNAPRVGCGAFSMGQDNKLGNNGDKLYKNRGTPSDDVISWQR